MKGVLLCGGEGTRLRPFTEVVNKHLIRVHTLPMSEYPLLKMIEAGIEDILIVSGGENFAAVVKYFGSGKKWNVTITHAIQDSAGGIAQALGLAKHFVGRDKVLVILGDNLFNMSLRNEVKSFNEAVIYKALLFSITSETPERFGVLKFDKQGNVVDVIEKPTTYVSDCILSGIYMYTSHVFDVISQITPSHRNELEITDVNSYYIRDGSAKVVKMSGWWTDCGKIETLLKAEELIKHDKSF